VNPFAPPTPAADTATADAQYNKWIQAGPMSAAIQVAANGVAFIPSYKNWRAVSSTDRFDNKTMRVILGNDVATKAIAENHINPWPDGATFAKVTWFQQPDGKGSIQTGEFQQVEFMIKDAKKYASTDGWGFARFRGADLKPYGKDAAFTNECTGCHEPVRKNDFVYTMPLQGQQ